MLQALIWAALGTGFTFLMTTLGAAVVFFFAEEPRPQFQRAMLGFAGVNNEAHSLLQRASAFLFDPRLRERIDAGRTKPFRGRIRLRA